MGSSTPGGALTQVKAHLFYLHRVYTSVVRALSGKPEASRSNQAWLHAAQGEQQLGVLLSTRPDGERLKAVDSTPPKLAVEQARTWLSTRC
jgi:hypothetical protein